MILPGNLIMSHDSSRSGKLGIVIAVMPCVDPSSVSNFSSSTYQRVYYVFFRDGTLEGPLFQSQLHDV